jgi:ribonuclease P protein component
VLTFAAPNHKGPLNRGGRRTDSAAVFILNTVFFEDTAHEAHLSAEQSRPRSSSRLSSAYGNCRRPEHIERTPRTWPQKALGLGRALCGSRDMRGYTVIKKRSDFLAANRGKRQATPGFVLLVFDRRDADPAKRLGITITKKVGNAVVRNRMRRRFRALAAEMLAELGKPGADHILIGRDGGIERDFGILRDEMRRAFGKLSA